ncbi:unnamed protein product [Phyllotreta striolata]|uniref:Uncharacterized protein n=1 Tax=Phyllotreta striolata TaxID=444603 RepID=A0A9N9TL06_PHYSR|nr:unnamed protein product [Phyllotreta striolata]
MQKDTNTTAMSTDIEKTSSHDLKCTVCKNYLNVPPILTSDDGKLNKCGRCQYKPPRLDNRNTLYESIGSKLLFPCMHAGCPVRLQWSQVGVHEKSCKRRSVRCPFYNCRDKDVSFVLAEDSGHFESCHPGCVHYGPLTVAFRIIKHHQSFIKLLVIDGTPFLMLVHCLKYGESAVLFGVFSCDEKPYEYEIKIRTDADEGRSRTVIVKERVPLYDEDRHCLYCLQNICSIDGHRYSKKHPEHRDDKYKYYASVDVASAKSLLQTDNMLFDVNVYQVRNDENNSIISRNSD